MALPSLRPVARLRPTPSVPRRSAAIAAARVSRASLFLEGLGLVSAAFVLIRLFESWRVTPHAASHRIAIFGQKLSYPSANAGAIVMLALAAYGLTVTVMAISGMLRELTASRRLQRQLRLRRARVRWGTRW